MRRYKSEIAWFSRLVRHPAGKWRRSIVTTLEPARHYVCSKCNKHTELHWVMFCRDTHRRALLNSRMRQKPEVRAGNLALITRLQYTLQSTVQYICLFVCLLGV